MLRARSFMVLKAQSICWHMIIIEHQNVDDRNVNSTHYQAQIFRMTKTFLLRHIFCHRHGLFSWSWQRYYSAFCKGVLIRSKINTCKIACKTSIVKFISYVVHTNRSMDYHVWKSRLKFAGSFNVFFVSVPSLSYDGQLKRREHIIMKQTIMLLE